MNYINQEFTPKLKRIFFLLDNLKHFPVYTVGRKKEEGMCIRNLILRKESFSSNNFGDRQQAAIAVAA